jgi:uncharacterized membrane protein YdjX (TVP38/TMEM64 family)
MARSAVIRRLLIVGTVLAIAGLGVVLLPHGDQPVVRLAQAARDTGSAGVAIFFLAYVVSTVALLPGSVLTLAAGFAYGPLWGLMLASPASVAGATAAFLLGRTLLRDWASRKVAKSPKARVIDSAVEREGFKLVLLLRLSPVFPFNVLNYALSLSKVRLGTYVMASFLGMLPGTALYVYLGALAPAAAELTSSASGAGLAQRVLYVGGLGATVAVAVIATRAARRALASELPDTG